MRAKVITFVILVMLAVLGATPAYSQDIPPLPHAFYGRIEINGSPAPIGTQIEARGEGVRTGIEGNPIVTTEVGVYGSPDPMGPKLVVQGDILDGATITFYINGFPAEQTAAWHSGEVTELNFTAAMPTVTTDEATGIGATAATLNGTLVSLGNAPSVAVSFEWGTTTSYGDETTAQTMTTTGAFSAALSNLTTNTTYHFRAKAVAQGISYGIDRTFTTKAAGGGGGGGVKDTTPPRIFNIRVTDITKTSANVNWDTNEMSDSQVEYWASPGQLSPLDTEMTIYHAISLTNLNPGSTYYFRVMSRDAADNLGVSDQHAFSTLAGAAVFAASELSISPSEVYTGETVTISVLINNTGDGAGSYTVTLKINGVVEATKDITLNAGASQEVTFSTVKDVAGSYSVEVNGLSGSFIVKEKPALPTTPPPSAPVPTPTPPVAPGINWHLLWSIIGGVVIVGLIIFLVVRRRGA
jgi:hypothetical protein